MPQCAQVLSTIDMFRGLLLDQSAMISTVFTHLAKSSLRYTQIDRSDPTASAPPAVPCAWLNSASCSLVVGPSEPLAGRHQSDGSYTLGAIRRNIIDAPVVLIRGESSPSR
jgi:hypothetical protein